MSELDGKTVVVTGASKGIGAAIAAAMGAAGAHVVAQYGRDREGAEAATTDIPRERLLLIGADFTDPANTDAFWNSAQAWRGQVDALINNAAVMRLAGGIDDDLAEWERVWDEAARVNMQSPARLMRHAVRHFLDRDGGTIVTISSWVTSRGSANPGGIAYAATKAAITAATKTVARSYARQGVLAYCIAPGVVRTRMSEESAATLGGEAAVSAGLAMGEWVPPSDIAELCVFLASGRCRHLTGATIDVNGATYMR